MAKVIFIIILFCSYCFFSVWVFSSGTEKKSPVLTLQMAEGKKIWQEKNCISCHQLYGLGGYLGPDLTNIMSDEKRGKSYAEAFLRSGGPTMPNFKLTDAEVNAVLDYLAYVDASTKPAAK